MAVTHITSGKSISDAVHYTTDGTAHVPNKYIGNQRDLLNLAVNGSNDPKTFIKEAKRQINRTRLYHKGQAQEVRTIISFDPKQINIKHEDAPLKAGKLARKIAKTIYPHNSSFIAIQADGEGNNKYHVPIIHAHIITCARRIDNGKSITHTATFKRMIPKIDQVIQDSGYKRPANPYRTIKKTVNGHTKKYEVLKNSDHDNSMVARKTNERLEKQGKHGWIHQLSSILNNAKSQSKDMHQYILLAYKNGVTVNPFRMRRVKGTKSHGKFKYKFHVYKSNKTKSGTLRKGRYVKIDDSLIKLLANSGTANIAKNASLSKHKGEFLRLGKQIKYTYNNKVVRAKKLGSVYDRPALFKDFKVNDVKARAKDALELDKLLQQSRKYQRITKPQAQSMMSSARTLTNAINRPQFSSKASTTGNVVSLHGHQSNNHNKIGATDLGIVQINEPLQKYSLKHHDDGAPYIKSLPKPKLVPTYHMRPSSQPVANALNRVKTLSQRIAKAKKVDKKDLIMKRRAAKDKFNAEAQDFMDKVYKSQADYEQAKQTNADELSKYRGIVKAYREHQAQNEAEDRVADAVRRLAEMRMIRRNQQGPEL